MKSHLVRIYAKLEAGNRNEALGRAVALGLLALSAASCQTRASAPVRDVVTLAPPRFLHLRAVPADETPEAADGRRVGLEVGSWR